MLLASPLVADAPTAADLDRAARRREMILSRLAEVPRLGYSPIHPTPRTPLRRTHDLLRAFFEGEGALAPEADSAPLHPSPRLELTELPWTVTRTHSSYLVTWSPPHTAQDSDDPFETTDDAVLGFVLRRGQSWCSPTLPLEDGTRLRFEVGRIESGPEAFMRLEWRPANGGDARSWAIRVGSPRKLSEAEGVDQPLPGGRGSLCFVATEAALFVGEPRVLAPEFASADARPRWVVVTILDALRADVATEASTSGAMPVLHGLAARGRSFTNAFSPGAHTRAALWPILMGRDTMRIDPRLAWRPSPAAQVPIAPVYANGNLFVSHLAESAGYHSVFLGNNSFLRGTPAFSRYTNRGRRDRGTIETIAELPALLRRYADERVLLVYYVSTLHSESSTPLRLFREMGCDRAPALETTRCAYWARARHADEAVSALQDALADYGLDGATFQIVSADHGEVLQDGRRVETFNDSAWWHTSEGHGAACHPVELHVPLIVAAPTVATGVWAAPVSTLDVVPTLCRLLQLQPVARLDGTALPLEGTPRSGVPARRLHSWGYCTDSILEGTTQFIRWGNDCWIRRAIGATELMRHQSELWTNGRLAATDAEAPERLAPWVDSDLEWLADTHPGEALILKPEALDGTRVVITALDGEIVDYGPSASVARLDRLRVQLSEDRRRLAVDFGSFRDHFRVATWPPLAPVRVDTEPPAGAGQPRTFVGRLQLPLPAAGQRLEPERRPSFWLAAKEPSARTCAGPCLRLWWQAPGVEGPAATADSGHLERVLREWGYIR